MGSEALQLALAVYRTPIKRHALYDMALPHDIGLVLQLASAPQPLLSEIAADVDESEDTIVEASRFYLQLALFQPEADAYRVLGLADDAPRQRIREHYRWLQRWLHPDRRGEDWEALFATRVNWAWSNLRNDAVRRAYDADHDRGASTHSGDSAVLDARRVPEWTLVPAHHRISRAGQLLIGALLCSCAGLLYVALTRNDGIPQDEVGARSAQEAQDGGETVTLSSLPASASGSPVSTLTEKSSPVSETSMPDRDHGARAIAALVTGNEGQDKPSHKNDSAEPEHVAQAPASNAKVDLSNEGPAHQPERPVAASPKPSGEPLAADDGSAPLPKADRKVSTATVAQKELGLGSSPESMKPPGGEPSDMAVRGEAARSNAGRGESIGTTDALARIDLAHKRVKELSTFFSKFDSRLPPIWNDLAGQANAEAQRSALFERAGLRDPGDFVVDDPRWRMSESSAALSASYHLLKRNSVSESGRLSLSMVWRERMWLVTQVELSPAL